MGVLREPLLHFLILGALVCAATRLLGEDPRYVVDAGPQQRERLTLLYRQQYGTQPTQTQVESLLAQYVRSEILYREGLALGLDRDDEIVRRRIVQKLEFVNDDVSEPALDEQALHAYFASHRQQYVQPRRVSFIQLYFSPDQAGDGAARRRAAQALAALRGSAAQSRRARSIEQLADPFPDGSQFSHLDADGITRLFGASPFSQAVLGAPLAQWSGPVRSGLGWHVFAVGDIQAEQPLTYAEVHDRVANDAAQDLRQNRSAAEYRKLAAKYRVVTDAST